ncbi:putative protein OS=Tsukamurella paurometabola (strain ATCC 8368 / DSM / CCUG 35730 /CIP 100753 / JCM 10117 / KCTC 9821 / NBRC 16120 / NCIMB 702349/ NCTC 13040) OX=521096 GN=Tpau_1407 PE=4 SV=1 [Tsukamurella paurometabola]|uniref:Uncharacterized protein n=1 Tax=Tsukamurella paurometabola (strain ATCC 8368 / DSM 20162 / CCUG 35730 / CIP 100753 / JCM 10117 / KCTC 9821 / NBRC 16120 / NCIMB 702349 / NCTC 13040) TaxID=521096 RepID=D5UXE3_TSUPD|nr:hypothetical protein [Tsukamurella paurometabola]ADG78035.1 hypothetical protein Tpau_1407 [Tsukamurella paurometabola DSM 20162]SUP29880.1 Uncharacterised protein [Tsukamurella paurometabola]
MTGPGNHDDPNYRTDQAYSQAIPLPTPPRGPAAPGAVPGAAPPPPQKPKSNRNLIVGLVAAAAVVALVAAIVVAALLNDAQSGDGAGTTASPSSGQTAELFRANDCLYDVPEAPKVGNCDDGGSPYKVTQVMPAGEQCKDDQTSISKGRSYCLTPNLNVNYCYTTPVPGTWIKAAPRCGAPGTISVVSVVPGFKDPNRCTGDWDVNYTFNAPVYTICAKSYT